MANRLAAYYWMSKNTGRRVGWFHPSRTSAMKWKKARYFKFVDFPILEDYLKTKSKSRHTVEKTIWTRHMEGFNDLILKRGTIIT